MALNWNKWGRDFFASLGRHIGTAGMTWLGLGVKDGQIEWHNLWLALITGAVLPTVFTYLQSTPVPEETTVSTPQTDNTTTSN